MRRRKPELKPGEERGSRGVRIKRTDSAVLISFAWWIPRSIRKGAVKNIVADIEATHNREIGWAMGSSVARIDVPAEQQISA